MKMPLIALKIALAFLFNRPTTLAQDVAAAYEGAATKPCHELRFLAEVIRIKEQEEARAHRQVKELRKAGAMLSAALCATSSEAERLKLQALYTMDSAQLNKAVSELDKLPALNAALATLRARQAQVLLVLHRGTEQATITPKGGTAEKTVLGANGNTPKGCGFAIQTTPAKHAVCEPDSAADAAITGAAMHLDKLKALKLLDNAVFDGVTITGTAAHVGTLAVDDSNNGDGWCDGDGTAAGASSNTALGVIHVKTKTASTTLTSNNIGTSGKLNEACQDTTGEKFITDNRKVTNKVVAAAICSLRATKLEATTSYLDKDFKDLLNDQTATTVAEQILYGNIKKDGDAEHKKAALKKLFGFEEGNVLEKIINPLANKHINYKVNDENSKKTIGEAASEADGHIALAACYGQLYRDTLKKQVPTTATVVSVEKCKEDTEENECKKDKDCEHKDGKCKLKEGVKVDEKKEEKCTGKEQKDCEKAIECK
uniref:Variant surface glycoprotein 1078 n=1 Tax=Trypanosoma brucei TaxID=5691 RepID=M4SUJ2_9TRYP|nr:variant surface glycoprotein 1078 [Trypanosoma brucei]